VPPIVPEEKSFHRQLSDLPFAPSKFQRHRSSKIEPFHTIFSPAVRFFSKSDHESIRARLQTTFASSTDTRIIAVP
jgi:hypothetical protein